MTNIVNKDDIKVMTREEEIQKEKDLFFEGFLKRYYFDLLKEGRGENRTIELYITSKCTGNCSYCYLIRHGEELYPYDLLDEDKLINNLKIFIDWYKENKFSCEINLFTGEIITTGFFFKLMEVFYEGFKEKYYPYKPWSISLAEAGDFLNSDYLTEKVQNWIDKFKEIDIDLHFSLSIDGKVLDEKNRGRKHLDEFYQKAMNFAEKNFLAFHPMVSAYNIEDWIANYDWWHSSEVPKQIGDRIMMLEVRDNNWTNDKITEYLKFLNYVFDKELERTKEDKITFAKRIFGIDSYPSKGYDNISLNFLFTDDEQNDQSGMGCSVQRNLCIRLGDFAVAPCHRTSYKDFIGGYFKVENGKIVGYHGENVEIMCAINSWNRTTSPKCARCDVACFCPSGCFGSNYESTHDLFTTPETVCNLMKARIYFILMKVEEMGLMPYLPQILSPSQYDTVLKLRQKIISGFERYGDAFGDAAFDAHKLGKGTDNVTLST